MRRECSAFFCFAVLPPLPVPPREVCKPRLLWRHWCAGGTNVFRRDDDVVEPDSIRRRRMFDIVLPRGVFGDVKKEPKKFTFNRSSVRQRKPPNGWPPCASG